MKKELGLVLLVLSLAVTLVACSSGGGDDGLEAPSVGSASDLPATGATAPSDTATALAVYSGAMQGLSKGVGSSVTGSKRSGRGTDTITDTINWTDESGSITGTITGTYTVPDSFDLQPGKAYDDLLKVVLAVNIDGTINGATFTDDGGHSYTVSGKMKETFNYDYSLDVVTDTNGDLASGDIDYAFEVAFGTAFAIKRDDGVGAKFVLTFANSYAQNNVSLENASFDVDSSFLENASATLTVFDDNNAKILETTIPLSDIENLDPNMFLGE